MQMIPLGSKKLSISPVGMGRPSLLGLWTQL